MTSTKRQRGAAKTSLPNLHALPDVAEQFGIPYRPLREAACRDEFAHVHIGRKRLLTDEQLVELLKRYERRPAGDAGAKRQRPARRRRVA